MTVTHTRFSAARAIATMTTDAWPAFTTHLDRDVVVAALSMTRLVEWCGTPCVHTADAVEPHTGGRPSESELASVLVSRVLLVEWRSDLRLHVVVDSDLSGCQPTLAEARILGRDFAQTASPVVFETGVDGGYEYAADMPSDIEVGDLVAFPCRGVTLLHAVKVSPRH